MYFVLAVAVLGQSVQNGALLKLTGEAAKIEFGGALSLIYNSTEDELVCSGKIRASNVVIEGTTTTVADLVGEVANLKAQLDGEMYLNRPFRVGNRILNLFSAGLPGTRVPQLAATSTDSRCVVYNSTVGWVYCPEPGVDNVNCKPTRWCWTASGFLHMQTNLPCSVNAETCNPDGILACHKALFYFHVFGYSYTNAEVFDCTAAGRYTVSQGFHQRSDSCTGGTPASTTSTGTKVSISTYCGPSSGNVVLRLQSPTATWSESDITVDFIGGGNYMMERAARRAGGVRMIAAQFNTQDQVY